MRKDGKDSEAHVGLAAKQVTLATMVIGSRSTSRQRPFPSLRIVWEKTQDSICKPGLRQVAAVCQSLTSRSYPATE